MIATENNYRYPLGIKLVDTHITECINHVLRNEYEIHIYGNSSQWNYQSFEDSLRGKLHNNVFVHINSIEELDKAKICHLNASESILSLVYNKDMLGIKNCNILLPDVTRLHISISGYNTLRQYFDELRHLHKIYMSKNGYRFGFTVDISTLKNVDEDIDYIKYILRNSSIHDKSFMNYFLWNTIEKLDKINFLKYIIPYQKIGYVIQDSKMRFYTEKYGIEYVESSYDHIYQSMYHNIPEKCKDCQAALFCGKYDVEQPCDTIRNFYIGFAQMLVEMNLRKV